MSGNVKHPLAKVFDALVEGGVSTSQVYAVARKILAAYSEANEGRTATEEAPCPARP